MKATGYRVSDFRSDRRNRLEIMAAIVALTQQPTSFTRLMNHANLSSSLLNKYLKFMTGRRLIMKLDTAGDAKKRVPVYQATKKGKRFLRLCCEQLILLHGERFLEKNRDGLLLASMFQKKQIQLPHFLS